MRPQKESGRMVGLFMTAEMDQRLRLEAARTNRTRREIITQALDEVLPRNIKIVADKTARTKSAE